jgi:hypothetical protein
LEKANYQREAEDVHGEEDPKRHRPALRLGDEGRQQGTHIRADDDE